MKTLFLFFLSIVYLFLAFEMETPIIRKMYFVVAFVLLLLAARDYLVSIYLLNKEIAELEQASEEAYKKIPHTQILISEDYLCAFLINTHTNTLYIANKEDLEAQISCKEIPFEKIYEVAIVEDGDITKANARHKNGLLVKKDKPIPEDDTKEEEGSKISLKIVIDELSDPIVELVVMESDDTIAKDDEAYKEAYSTCEKWYQKMSIIIKRYELEHQVVRKWQ